MQMTERQILERMRNIALEQMRRESNPLYMDIRGYNAFEYTEKMKYYSALLSDIRRRDRIRVLSLLTTVYPFVNGGTDPR